VTSTPRTVRSIRRLFTIIRDSTIARPRLAVHLPTVHLPAVHLHTVLLRPPTLPSTCSVFSTYLIPPRISSLSSSFNTPLHLSASTTSIASPSHRHTLHSSTHAPTTRPSPIESSYLKEFPKSHRISIRLRSQSRSKHPPLPSLPHAPSGRQLPASLFGSSVLPH